jgi:hypothetical protein
MRFSDNGMMHQAEKVCGFKQGFWRASVID